MAFNEAGGQVVNGCEFDDGDNDAVKDVMVARRMQLDAVNDELQPSTTNLQRDDELRCCTSDVS